MNAKEIKNRKATKTAKPADKKEKKTEKKKTNKVKAKFIVPAIFQEIPDGGWETKVGRPRVLDPDYAVNLMEKEIERYVSGEMTTYEEIPVGNGFKLKPIAPPTLIDIALKCGVTVETLHRHAEEKNEDGSLKNKQLFDTINVYRQMTLAQLMKGGLTRDYDARVVEFLANVNHGMIPRSQVEQKVEISPMDKVYEELDGIYSGEEQRLNNQRQEMMKRKAELDEMNKE